MIFSKKQKFKWKILKYFARNENKHLVGLSKGKYAKDDDSLQRGFLVGKLNL